VPCRGVYRVALPDMLHGPEAVLLEQRRHFGWGEKAQPGLATLGCGWRDEFNVGFARPVPHTRWQHVVRDDFCAGREAADFGPAAALVAARRLRRCADGRISRLGSCRPSARMGG
jgi:hypothetical protein